MVLTNEEKAYIAQRMLSSNPANGLSAKDFRRKVGIITDSKQMLAKEVSRLMAGLSDAESERILSTNPYLAVDPSNLALNKNMIDYSSTNAALLRRKKYPANEQAPRTDREIPHMEAFMIQDEEPESSGDYYRGSPLPDLKAAGAAKKTRAKSEWNKFVQKVSKWPSLSTMGSNKMRALSLLYKEASQSDLKKFAKLEHISPEEMKRHLNI